MRKKKKKKNHGNPLFNFRLSKERADTLKDVARLYGASSASAFAREIIMVVCSGRREEIEAFVVKVQSKIAKATLAELTAAVQAPANAILTAKEGKLRA